MRTIDRWLGTPICFVLSVLSRLLSRKPSGPPRNILVIQLPEAGSIALAYPALRRLKERFPGARIHFLVFHRNRVFPPLLGLVDKADVLTLDDSSGLKFFVSSLRFFREVRRRNIDTTLDFDLFARASAVLGFLSGARWRAGFDNYRAEGLYRGSLFTHCVFYNPYRHISLNCLAMTEAVGRETLDQPALKEVVTADLAPPRITTPPERAEAMRQRLRQCYSPLSDQTRIVVLSPYSGNLLPMRAWPMEHYARYVEKLLERSDDVIAVVIGLSDAAEPCRPLFDAISSSRLIDFIGQTHDIAEVIDLLNVADLLVASDSGPPHFASLAGIPSIVLFGPETPDLYAPLGPKVQTVFLGLHCSPCVSAFNHRNTPCTNNVCMQQIAPERIAEMTFETLEKDA